MELLRLVILSVACLVTLSAHADDRQTPTYVFRGQTQYEIVKCQTEEKIAANKAELGSDDGFNEVGSCIVKAKTEARKDFAPALKSVSKNVTATKLLKDYYATWITAIDAVIPRPEETKEKYSARQAAQEEKYEAAWTRFEAEAGI
jgi:hypothetical protein